jgi:hypothetical protein
VYLVGLKGHARSWRWRCGRCCLGDLIVAIGRLETEGVLQASRAASAGDRLAQASSLLHVLFSCKGGVGVEDGDFSSVTQQQQQQHFHRGTITAGSAVARMVMFHGWCQYRVR